MRRHNFLYALGYNRSLDRHQNFQLLRRMDGKLLWTRQYDMCVTQNKRILATILTPELEKILSRNHDEKVIWHLLEMGLSKQS